MLVGLLGHEQPAFGQVRDDVAVRILDEPPGEHRDRVVERPVGLERVQHRETLGPRNGRIVLAERWSDVHDARAVVGADEVCADHPLAGLIQWQDGERPAIAPAGEVIAGEALEDRRVGVPASSGGLGQDQVPPAGRIGDPDVLDGRADRRRDVGDEGPRGGRPDEQVGIARGVRAFAG